MTATEYTLLATALLLLAGNAVALAMWRRTRTQRDTALDTVDALHANAERTINSIGRDLHAVTVERDRATKRAALAESREAIAHAGWGRAVDKLLTPAPLTISAPQLDRASLEAIRDRQVGRHLQVVPHG